MSKIISPTQGLIRPGRSGSGRKRSSRREQKCPLLGPTSPQSPSDSSLDSESYPSDRSAEENTVPNMANFRVDTFRNSDASSTVSTSTSVRVSKAAERRRTRNRAVAAKVEAARAAAAKAEAARAAAAKAEAERAAAAKAEAERAAAAKAEAERASLSMQQQEVLAPPSSFSGPRASSIPALLNTSNEDQSDVSAHSARSSQSGGIGADNIGGSGPYGQRMSSSDSASIFRRPHPRVLRRPPPLSVSDPPTNEPQRFPSGAQGKSVIPEEGHLVNGADTPSNGGGIYIPIISPITGQNVTTGQSGALQFVPAYAESSNPISCEDSVASSTESGISGRSGSKSGSGAGGRPPSTFRSKFGKALTVAKSSMSSPETGKVASGVAREIPGPRLSENGGTSWDQCVDPADLSQQQNKEKERAQTVVGVSTTSGAGKRWGDSPDKGDTSVQSTVTSDSFTTDFYEHEQDNHGQDEYYKQETQSENSFIATKHQKGTAMGNGFRRRSRGVGGVSAEKMPRDAASSPAKGNELDGAISAHSSTQGSSGGKKGKVSRLASLFSSRAVVKGGSGGGKFSGDHGDLGGGSDTGQRRRAEISTLRIQTSATELQDPKVAAPLSPSQSSVSGSSSAYVGWPGTQDKRGGTVAIQQSYDESEDGALPSRSKIRGTNEEEMGKAATTQMQDWMNEEGEDAESSDEDGSHASDDDVERRIGASARRLENPADYDETGSVYESYDEGDEDPADCHLAAAVASAQVAIEKDEDDRSYSETSEENPADFYLASAVASVTAASSSPLVSRSSHEPPQQLPTQHANSVSSQDSSLKRRPNSSPEQRRPFANSTNSFSKRSPEPTYASNRNRLSPANNSTQDMGNSRKPQAPWTTPQNKRGGRHSSNSISVRSEGASPKGGINIQNLFGSDEQRKDATRSRSLHGDRNRQGTSPTERVLFRDDPWDVDGSPARANMPREESATSSHNQSSYQRSPKSSTGLPQIDTSASERRMKNAGRGEKIRSPGHQPPTEAALAASERMTPSPLKLNAHNIKGYRPFLEKTKDVPNLIDEVDSESQTSASTRDTSIFSGLMGKSQTGVEANSISSALPRGQGGAYAGREQDAESDIFDDLSTIGADSSFSRALRDDDHPPKKVSQEESLQRATFPKNKQGDQLTGNFLGAAAATPVQNNQGDNNMNIVMIGNGLATLQSSPEDFEKRETSFEFDANLTDTDVDQNGFNIVPDNLASRGGIRKDRRLKREKNANIGENGLFDNGSLPFPGDATTDTGSSASSYVSEKEHHDEEEETDLSVYSVHPQSVRKLVRSFRKMCNASENAAIATDSVEDAKKTFALFEMRSRIMETDIERRLERQGGTVPVDDLVLTPSNQAACRIRDAVIVSKAWRDGANPRDVITASLLTRQADRKYFVRRLVARGNGRQRRTGRSTYQGVLRGGEYRSYTLEEVRWVDDTDFMQFRCPSLGPRCMRGFEIFTIGDCQSILLKLTNERCVQLRKELNDATARQLDAEELMKEEAGGENDTIFDDVGTMTDAEDAYLTAMEEVKTLSKQLVLAEKAFQLVRDRIENLVATYQALLVKLEDESCDDSASEASFDSAYSEDEAEYDSEYDEEEEDDREKQMLARRAQRAELKAEVAAREVVLAKQEAEKIREEKQRELEELQKKLAELETKSAHLEEEYGRLEADRRSGFGGSIAESFSGRSRAGSDAKSLLQSAHSIEQGTTEATERVKAKFRSRHIQRKSPTQAKCEPERNAPTRFEHGRDTGVRLGDTERERSRNRQLLNGEEMYQHLDFYERSLRAVENQTAFVQ